MPTPTCLVWYGSTQYGVADYASSFTIVGGDGKERTLLQLEGSLNGAPGIFERIVDPDESRGVTHRRFIRGGTITGKPNQRPKRD